MEFMVTVFIAIVAIMVVVSTVVFGFVFFRAARFSGKVFNQVERELEHHAAASEAARPVDCQYCGSRAETAPNCSNCGAPIA